MVDAQQLDEMMEMGRNQPPTSSRRVRVDKGPKWDRDDWLARIRAIFNTTNSQDVMLKALDMYAKAEGWLKQQDTLTLVAPFMVEYWAAQLRMGAPIELVPPKVRAALTAGNPNILDGSKVTTLPDNLLQHEADEGSEGPVRVEVDTVLESTPSQ